MKKTIDYFRREMDTSSDIFVVVFDILYFVTFTYIS